MRRPSTSPRRLPFTGDTNPNGSEVGIYGLEPNGAGSAAIYVNGNNCVMRGSGTVLTARLCTLHSREQQSRRRLHDFRAALRRGLYHRRFRRPAARAETLSAARLPASANTLSAGNSGVRIDGPAPENVVIGNTLLTGSFYGVEVRSAPSSGSVRSQQPDRRPDAGRAQPYLRRRKVRRGRLPDGGQVSLQDAQSGRSFRATTSVPMPPAQRVSDNAVPPEFGRETPRTPRFSTT